MRKDPTRKSGEEEESQSAWRRRQRKAMTQEAAADPGPMPGGPTGLPEEWPQAPRRRSAKVRYLGQGVYVCNGPSGQRYRFAGHGAVLSVKGDDLDDILGRVRVQRGCCGSAGVRSQQLFSPA